ncbi:hypothetical protein CVIRNUC_005530 [Coccomyxa viridis]|uniref:Uncharacterized protein n=1 Tax=Coccomyxa viridis TaxID=1274662 RepID=A0AAV1I652_9CHLO|nr:hypothetical protein CVIRNUC_005530 [Coccomyxa viridis]
MKHCSEPDSQKPIAELIARQVQGLDSGRPTQHARMAAPTVTVASKAADPLAPLGSTLRQPTEQEAAFLLPPLPCGLKAQGGMGTAPGPNGTTPAFSAPDPSKMSLEEIEAAMATALSPRSREVYEKERGGLIFMNEVLDLAMDAADEDAGGIEGDLGNAAAKAAGYSYLLLSTDGSGPTAAEIPQGIFSS